MPYSRKAIGQINTSNGIFSDPFYGYFIGRYAASVAVAVSTPNRGSILAGNVIENLLALFHVTYLLHETSIIPIACKELFSVIFLAASACNQRTASTYDGILGKEMSFRAGTFFGSLKRTGGMVTGLAPASAVLTDLRM
jgi:hypothetical protein